MISIKEYVEIQKQLLKDAFSLQKLVDKEKYERSGEITLHIIQVGDNQASNAYIINNIYPIVVKIKTHRFSYK